MFMEDGSNVVLRIRVKTDLEWTKAGEHRVAVDNETYAHFLNNPEIEVLEEVMHFVRSADPAVTQEIS